MQQVFHSWMHQQKCNSHMGWGVESAFLWMLLAKTHLVECYVVLKYSVQLLPYEAVSFLTNPHPLTSFRFRRFWLHVGFFFPSVQWKFVWTQPHSWSNCSCIIVMQMPFFYLIERQRFSHLDANGTWPLELSHFFPNRPWRVNSSLLMETEPLMPAVIWSVSSETTSPPPPHYCWLHLSFITAPSQHISTPALKWRQTEKRNGQIKQRHQPTLLWHFVKLGLLSWRIFAETPFKLIEESCMMSCMD